MALISSKGLPPACRCTICTDFLFFVFYSFRTCSFSYFYSTYTTGTGDYYKLTYLASNEQCQRAYDDEHWQVELMVRRQEERRAKVAGTHVIADGKFPTSGISIPSPSPSRELRTWRTVLELEICEICQCQWGT